MDDLQLLLNQVVKNRYFKEKRLIFSVAQKQKVPRFD